MVYLPHGSRELQISATPLDEFAKNIDDITVSLSEGVNTVKLLCTAEDGTVGEYTLTVYVMPRYSGFTPIILNKIPLEGEPILEGDLLMCCTAW